MLVNVFKSPRKPDTYLYLPKGADFQALPQALQQTFGRPELALSLNLTPERRLAQHPATEILQALENQGFFLQLPPPRGATSDETEVC